MPLSVLKHFNVQDVTADCTGSIAHHNHYDQNISCSSQPIYTYKITFVVVKLLLH